MSNSKAACPRAGQPVSWSKYGLLLLGALVSLSPAAAIPSSPDVTAGEVTILRDAWGVPHVYGGTSAAVFYGAGYALARDRLAQMELSRWFSEGRAAELLGPSYLEQDRATHLNAYSDAELMEMFRALSPEHQQMMRAYVDGVNAYIDAVNADPATQLPYEFKEWGIALRHWELLDYVRINTFAGRSSDQLTNLAFYNSLLTRYSPAQAQAVFNDVLPLQDPSAVPAIPASEKVTSPQPRSPRTAAELAVAGQQFNLLAPQPAAGKPPEGHSRCLMVGPKRSATGHVLMMQATSDGPDIHLSGAGFDTAGFTGFGINVLGPPVMGRGPHHGWLLTDAQVPQSDVFAEKLNPANRYQYWYRGAWHDMQRRTDSIKVKGGQPVEMEVATTLHGPVIAWNMQANTAFARRDAVQPREALNTWELYVEAGRVQSIGAFENLMARANFPFGVCYGDEQGNIAFWQVGKYPVRATGVDPRLPTPGTGEYEWQGFVPFKQLPKVRNPAQGYFHTWNGKITADATYGAAARYGETFRTYTGLRELQADGAITPEKLKEINRKIRNAIGAVDLTATSPEFFMPALRAAAVGADARIQQAVRLMGSWNGLYEDLDGDGRYDNAGLVLFRTWLGVAGETLLGESLGDWWHRIDDAKYIKYRTQLLLRILQGSRASAPTQHDFFKGRPPQEVIRETLARTIEILQREFNTADLAQWHQPIYWKYYDPTLKARNPDKPELNSAREEVVTRTAVKLGLSPALVPANGGEGWTAIFELAPQSRVLYDVTEQGGQDLFIDQQGHGNPHLGDQVELHLHNRFKALQMDREAIAVTAESVVTLHVPASVEHSGSK